MNTLNYLLPPKLYEVIDRAGISTPSQIILLSVWDIKKFTNLSTADICLVKKIVGDNFAPDITTCNKLSLRNYLKLSTGCQYLDDILCGGYRRGTITEVYGESGTGKTQLAMQAVAHNWPDYSVYICTEDLFPVKRFEEIQKRGPNYTSSVNYGENTYVEHITEGMDLLSCIRVRLPKLLQQHTFTLIVLDSVAAPFRCESTNYVQRAEELRELAVSLLNLAQENNLAVLCINQVTTSFDQSIDMLPSLGLAWSNMISTRLWLRKTDILDSNNTIVRELSVVFAPDLPNITGKFSISANGITNVR